MHIGRRFKELRKQRNVTLSEAVGNECSVAALSKFENELSEISSETFIHLVNRLHIDWREFQSDKESAPFLPRYQQAVDQESPYQLLLLQYELVATHKDNPENNIAYCIVQLTLMRDYPATTTPNHLVKKQAVDYLIRVDHWNQEGFIMATLLVGLVPLSVVDLLIQYVLYQIESADTPQSKLDLANTFIADAALRESREGNIENAKKILLLSRQNTIPDLLVATHLKYVDCLIRQQAGDPHASGQLTQLRHFMNMINAGKIAKRWEKAAPDDPTF